LLARWGVVGCANSTVVHEQQHSKFKLIIEMTQTPARGNPFLKHFDFGRAGLRAKMILFFWMMDDG
jgi:hypothetical protein